MYLFVLCSSDVYLISMSVSRSMLFRVVVYAAVMLHKRTIMKQMKRERITSDESIKLIRFVVKLMKSKKQHNMSESDEIFKKFLLRLNGFIL